MERKMEMEMVVVFGSLDLHVEIWSFAPELAYAFSQRMAAISSTMIHVVEKKCDS